MDRIRAALATSSSECYATQAKSGTSGVLHRQDYVRAERLDATGDARVMQLCDF